jgi:hypothetical protein
MGGGCGIIYYYMKTKRLDYAFREALKSVRNRKVDFGGRCECIAYKCKQFDALTPTQDEALIYKLG